MNNQNFSFVPGANGIPQKLPQSKIRIHALSRLFLHLALATAIYWASIFVLYFLLYQISGFLYTLLGASLYLSLINSRWLLIPFFYILLMLVVIGRSVWKLEQDLQKVTNAAEKLLVEEPHLPFRLREAEMALSQVRDAILRGEAAAREAEQKKNDLVVYLAHDLKTPLTSVIGYLSLLEECPDLPPSQRDRYTSITLEKAQRLEQLINEFFDITRFGLQSTVLEKNKIDFSMMLQQMADEFYPILLEKKLEILLSVEPNLTGVGDADKLARVFDNLLRNAVNYCYPESAIRLYAWKQENWIFVTVRNTCDPIPEEKISMLFEKFFRLDTSRGTSSGGAGLGLAISKQITELHGGTISVSSNPEFTDFTVALPVAVVNSSSSPEKS